MTEPYRDPSLPVTERVEDLLGRMTVEEKAGQLTQFFFFAPQEVPDDLDVSTGYNGHPASFAAYQAQLGDPTQGDHQRFVGIKQPVYIRDNVYLAGALPYEGENGARVLEGPAAVRVAVEGEEVHLEAQLPMEFADVSAGVVTGRDLGRVRLVDAEFEERDGTPAVLDIDLVGALRMPEGPGAPGPISTLSPTSARFRVW